MTRLTVASLVGGLALTGTLFGQAPAPSQTTPVQDAVNRVEELPEQSTSAKLRQWMDARRQEAQTRRIEEDLARERAVLSVLAGFKMCALPDGTTHPVNETVTFRGRRYQCIEVLDAGLAKSGVAWMRLPD